MEYELENFDPEETGFAEKFEKIVRLGPEEEEDQNDTKTFSNFFQPNT